MPCTGAALRRHTQRHELLPLLAQHAARQEDNKHDQNGEKEQGHRGPHA